MTRGEPSARLDGLEAACLVAIDCAVDGAELWHTDERADDELSRRIELLVREVARFG